MRFVPLEDSVLAITFVFLNVLFSALHCSSSESGSSRGGNFLSVTSDRHTFLASSCIDSTAPMRIISKAEIE